MQQNTNVDFIKVQSKIDIENSLICNSNNSSANENGENPFEINLTETDMRPNSLHYKINTGRIHKPQGLIQPISVNDFKQTPMITEQEYEVPEQHDDETRV